MDFWDLIFGEEEGLARVALRTKDKKFQQNFVRWPEEREKLETLHTVKERGDVYFSPALFNTDNHNGKKPGVKGARVAWVDLDLPNEYEPNGLPSPGAIVNSGRGKHIYWRVDPQPGLKVEPFNLYLMDKFGGDPTGWDANQFLRVPGTLNWKDLDHPLPVELVDFSPKTELLQEVHRLIRPSQELEVVRPISLVEALTRYPPDEAVKGLLERHPLEIFDRSNALFHLAAMLRERGVPSEAILTLLSYADSKWGKFSERDDKELRLQEIVSRVNDRTRALPSNLPSLPETRNSGRPTPTGWFALEESTPEISWVVEGLLREKGLMLLYGPTSVGKSTLAMNLCAYIATGAEKWLNWPIVDKEQRILYSSLEMDASEVMYFTSKMSPVFTDPHMRERLNDRLHFLPVGQPVYLDKQEGREYYEQYIKSGEYTGLVLDTLSASVSTSLSKEETQREIADWIDRMRQEHGIWVLVLHHPRKDQQGVKRRSQGDETDDLFGSRIIGDRSNSMVKILKGTSPSIRELYVPKSRFAPADGRPVIIQRNEYLFFSVTNASPVVAQKTPEQVLDEVENNDVRDNDVDGI